MIVFLPRPDAPRESAFWLTRIILALSVLAGMAAPLFEPRSIAHAQLAGMGDMGEAVVWAVFLLAGLLLIDALVNDLMPPRFVLPTKAMRVLIMMSMAFGHASILFVAVKDGDYSAVQLPLLLMAVALPVVAWLDVFARLRK